MKCSNCETEIPDPTQTLVVARGGKGAMLAVICKTCETGVLTMKVVLARRNDKDEFAFEGYLPVSSVK